MWGQQGRSPWARVQYSTTFLEVNWAASINQVGPASHGGEAEGLWYEASQEKLAWDPVWKTNKKQKDWQSGSSGGAFA
jgi:hypothetical protein